VENGPARNLNLSHTLQRFGQAWGEPLEVYGKREEKIEIITNFIFLGLL
jgi:hypothetical protein